MLFNCIDAKDGAKHVGKFRPILRPLQPSASDCQRLYCSERVSARMKVQQAALVHVDLGLYVTQVLDEMRVCCEHVVDTAHNVHVVDVRLHTNAITHHSYIIAGMQHCTTSAHEDEGAEAVWHLLLEGQKVWLIGRREDVEAMRTQLPPDETMSSGRLEASQREWVHHQRCIMVLQIAGDIICLPAQWPRTAKHLTDTLALQATMIQSWDSERALQLLDFTSSEVRSNDKYSAAM